MDENTVRLLDLFRAYEPDAELKELLRKAGEPGAE